MRYLLSLLLALALVSSLAATASAQLSDEQYVDEYFGTSALFTTATQVVDPIQGWWADSLPTQLTSDYGFAAGVVNTLRNQKGIKPLLAVDTMMIITGWEEAVEGGYQYHIDFIEMRPSEVQAIIDALGGVGKVLPGAQLSFRPVTVRSYYFSTMDFAEPVPVLLNGKTLNFRADTPLEQIKAAIGAAFRELYGKDVAFDLYVSQYSRTDGSNGADISIYATMGEG